MFFQFGHCEQPVFGCKRIDAVQGLLKVRAKFYRQLKVVHVDHKLNVVTHGRFNAQSTN